MGESVKAVALGCDTKPQSTVSRDNESKHGMGKETLVERYDGRSDIYVGRSMNGAPGQSGEAFILNCSAEIGSIQKVRVTHAYELDLSGEGM